MPIEIERKFLVVGDDWRGSAIRRQRYRQGYLSKTADCSIRVRRCGRGATLTVKGPRTGCAREEFEYAIPVAQAEEMLAHLCTHPLIDKLRHWVPHAGSVWQIDEYCGSACGLVLAEIELDRVEQPFAVPGWMGPEVTDDLRFRNSAIAQGAWQKALAELTESACAEASSDRPARRPSEHPSFAHRREGAQL